jgi:hypothetical protein
MVCQKIVLGLFISLLFCFTSFAQERTILVFDKPFNSDEEAIEAKLKSSETLKMIVSFIDETFILDQELSFVFGGEDGPVFDHEKFQIVIPYFFYDEVRKKFKKAGYSDSETGISPETATIDSIAHTMLHELAHALIYLYQIPIVGKEEDAADGLASVLLNDYFDEGGEMALNAADLFNLESQETKELKEADFWDDHGLDDQRYYSTICHVYGSNPKKYSNLATDSEFLKEKGDHCIEDYENLTENWHTILEEFMTKDDSK